MKKEEDHNLVCCREQKDMSLKDVSKMMSLSVPLWRHIMSSGICRPTNRDGFQVIDDNTSCPSLG
jgi:hypothetical protein